MRTVVITQPYVPAYRVPLFDLLRDKLQKHDLNLVVVSGLPDGDQANRGDAASGVWHRTISSRRLPVLRWTLDLRVLPRDLRKADLLVSELDALNLLAWRASFRRRPLVLWGHGKAYVNDPNPLADKIEWVLVRRAQHVMTYSKGGRAYLLAEGKIAPDKVTAIGNSTDTAALRSALLNITDARRTELSSQYGSGPTALYVGGLDASKRIDFLLAAAEAAQNLDDSFSLIVVGKGESSGLVLEAIENGARITYVPTARGAELAELASVCDAVWMPGRVGLVAVDALALNLPVHTVAHDFHAPEIEFLQDDEIAYLSDSAEGFAGESMALMAVTGTPHAVRANIPSLEAVTDKMVGVILAALQMPDGR